MQNTAEQVTVVDKKSRALGQSFYEEGIFLPKSGREIFEERGDLDGECEVILSTFQETSWGGCACKNS